MKYIRRSLLALAFLLPIAASLKVWLAGDPWWLQIAIYRRAGMGLAALFIVASICELGGSCARTKVDHLFAIFAAIALAVIPAYLLTDVAFVFASSMEQTGQPILHRFFRGFVFYCVLMIIPVIPSMVLLYGIYRLVRAVIPGLAPRPSKKPADAATGAKDEK